MTGDTLFFVGDYLNFGFPNHPLTSERFHRTVRLLQQRRILDRPTVHVVEPEPVDMEVLRLFHTEDHVELVKRKSEEGRGYLDYGDTPAYPEVYEHAMLYVGATVQAVHEVVEGHFDHGLQLVGGLHHATRSSSAGFCVFNDVGVAISYLLERMGIEGVLYFDIDAHHGDGVFYEFYDDPRVRIVDIHQDGRTLYPGRGFEWETGSGKARGAKMNIPLPPGSGDRELLRAVQAGIEFGEKAPVEMILVQAGTDGIRGDPITALSYSIEGHLKAVESFHQLSERCCDGKLVVFGGGGYNVESTSQAWANILDLLSA